jgi:hypothetical protein
MIMGRAASVARPTRRVPLGGVLAHGIMLAVMAVTMVGAHSPLRCLGGAGVLMIAAIAYAPVARRQLVGWEHLLDFWAMAGLLVIAVGSEAHSGGGAWSGGGEHQHLLSLDRAAGMVVIGVLWLGLRLLVLRLRARAGERIPARTWATSVMITAAGLAMMALYCG